METPVTTKKSYRGFYLVVAIVVFVNILLMVGLVVVSEVNKPELVDENYYTAGSIDSVKKQLRENSECGWSPFVECYTDKGKSIFTVWLSHSITIPTTGLTGTVALYRPSTQRLDRPPQPLISTSEYSLAANFTPPIARGKWDAILTISSPDGRRYCRRIPFSIDIPLKGNEALPNQWTSPPTK